MGGRLDVAARRASRAPRRRASRDGHDSSAGARSARGARTLAGASGLPCRPDRLPGEIASWKRLDLLEYPAREVRRLQPESDGRARRRAYGDPQGAMNQHDFRRMARALSNAVEGAHMGHPDFRLENRIFATIHPDPRHGMVKLTPEQQQAFVRDHPESFSPESGAWGRSGCTRVVFSDADQEIVGEALTLAWQNAAQENAARRVKTKKKRP